MPWPTPQEFNEAIQHPKTCFQDRELKDGQPELTPLGLPRPQSGAFASVYRLRCRGRDWAVRCFLNDIPDQEQRYEELTSFITTDDLPYTVGFEYQRNGIKIGRHQFPILKMEWVEGQPFLPALEAVVEHPQQVLQLADSFYQMMHELHRAGIAHGDLQHGNMIMVGNEIRLIDYDGMFVPSMKGYESNELGHRNYQHPGRTRHHFGDYLDNFSAWLIYLSLEILARDWRLWTKLKGGDECILFRRTDFEDVAQSQAFTETTMHEIEDIRNAANFLKNLLDMAPDHVPPLVISGSGLSFHDVPMPNDFERLSWRVQRWWHDVTAAPPWKHTNKARPQKPAVKQAGPEWVHDWLSHVRGLGSTPAPQPTAVTVQPKPVQTSAPKFEPTIAPTSGPPVNKQQAEPPKRNNPRETRSKRIRRLVDEAAEKSSKYKFDGAALALKEAEELADASNSIRLKLLVLSGVASTFGLQGDYLATQRKSVAAAASYEKAIAALHETIALRYAKSVEFEDWMLVRTLSSAAECYDRSGQFDKMLETLNAEIQTMRRLPGTAKRIENLEKRIQEIENERPRHMIVP